MGTLCKKSCKMRSVGPGEWRQWQYGNLTVPLYMPDPKAPPPKDGEIVKPLTEVAYLTVTAFVAKNAVKDLTDAISTLNAAPDSPGGRVSEQRFRNTLKDACKANLTTDEVEAIFPSPVKPKNMKDLWRRG